MRMGSALDEGEAFPTGLDISRVAIEVWKIATYVLLAAIAMTVAVKIRAKAQATFFEAR